MKETIFWDKSSYETREAACNVIGWRTNKGATTQMGKRIARTDWENLTAAARNVLLRHGVQP